MRVPRLCETMTSEDDYKDISVRNIIDPGEDILTISKVANCVNELANIGGNYIVLKRKSIDHDTNTPPNIPTSSQKLHPEKRTLQDFLTHRLRKDELGAFNSLGIRSWHPPEGSIRNVRIWDE